MAPRLPTLLFRSTLPVMMLATACGGSVGDGETAITSPTTASTTTTQAAPTTSAPPTTSAAPAATEQTVEANGVFDFEATLIGGEAFDSANYTGRDVLVWFWAPW